MADFRRGHERLFLFKFYKIKTTRVYGDNRKNIRKDGVETAGLKLRIIDSVFKF